MRTHTSVQSLGQILLKTILTNNKLSQRLILNIQMDLQEETKDVCKYLSPHLMPFYSDGRIALSNKADKKSGMISSKNV